MGLEGRISESKFRAIPSTPLLILKEEHSLCNGIYKYWQAGYEIHFLSSEYLFVYFIFYLEMTLALIPIPSETTWLVYRLLDYVMLSPSILVTGFILVLGGRGEDCNTI